jgi:hypothetical protein
MIEAMTYYRCDLDLQCKGVQGLKYCCYKNDAFRDDCILHNAGKGRDDYTNHAFRDDCILQNAGEKTDIIKGWWYSA